MDENGENIRRMVDGLLQAKQAKQTGDEQSHRRASELQQEYLTEQQRRRIEIPRLCSQFAIWATRHDIPYNSPSLLAHGWLLGRGSGPPSYHASHQGSEASGSSDYSLLVRPSSVRELVVHNVNRRHRRYHLLSRPAKIERYPISSVEESIANFSVRYGFVWDS